MAANVREKAVLGVTVPKSTAVPHTGVAEYVILNGKVAVDVSPRITLALYDPADFAGAWTLS